MKNNWTYPERVDHMRFTRKNQQKVLNEIDNPPQKRKSRKRFYGGLTTAVIVILLLGGAVFIPNIESVIAKIPYISQFIKDEEQRIDQVENFLDAINLVAEENGIKIGDLQIQMERKKVKVQVIGLSDENKSIADQISSQLEKAGFTSFDVKVSAYEEIEIKTERSKEEIEQDMQDSKTLKASLTKRLQAQGYELMFPVSVRINDREGIYMNVIVPKSEDRLGQLKEIMKEEAQAYGDEYKLDVRQVQKIAREQEKRWEETGALGDIGDALMEADHLPVTGFAYSFYPYPLQIKVKTSLDAGDPEASQVAEEIRTEIDLFIQSSERTQTIRDDRYNVVVLSKDKEKIKIE